METSNQLLVRYSCGCIGFRPFNDGTALIVDNCDKDALSPEGVTLSIRLIKSKGDIKSYKSIDEKKQFKLLQELASLVSHGHAFRSILGELGRVTSQASSFQRSTDSPNP